MKVDRANQAAKASLHARIQGRSLTDLPQGGRPSSLDNANLIQDALVELCADRVIGWKIGGKNAQAQEALGLDEPFAGRVLACSTHDSLATIGPEQCVLRADQTEFAVRLQFVLTAADLISESVKSAVDAVTPTNEIADTRYSDCTRVSTWHLIADNAKGGQIVPGARSADIGNLALAKVRSIVNGKERVQGTDADVLGHPLNANLWLANDRLKRGDTLRAGDIVSTGTARNRSTAKPVTKSRPC